MTRIQVDEPLELRYVPLSTVVLWERNPKLHDIQKIVSSIELHGFKNAPKFEPMLNDGVGGISAGNGRIEALAWLAAQQRPVPRGIGVVLNDSDEIVDWAVPINFGVDAKSQAAAIAYAIDDNNMVMAGGAFTPWDYARNWAPSYMDLVKELAAQNEPVASMNEDEISALLASALTTGSQIDLGYDSEHGSGFAEGEQFSTSYAAVIPLSDEQANDQELKLSLQRWCDEHNLSYKVAKR